MQFTLKEELPFIRKKGILSGYVEKTDGKCAVLVSGNFKQILKDKNYRELIKAAGLVDEVPDPRETSQETEEDTGQKSADVMTNKELKEEIAKLDPEANVRGLKKAELIILYDELKQKSQE